MFYLGRSYGEKSTLLANVNYDALTALGITVWQPRPFKHPAIDTQDTVIVPEPLRINARCAVILFEHEQQKILDGMLSVLALSAAELMLVRIYAANPDLDLIAKALRQWNPYTVLQLSMDLPVVGFDAELVRTFSPAYLALNPQHKPQAYKDLLTLRKFLHHGTS